jgi:hypothetical protein
MRLKIIACEVFFREIAYCSFNSKNIIDVDLMKQGLHNYPDQLRTELQERINNSTKDKYDAILIGYGLCSNGIENIKATHTKLVVPKAHDCLTLFLGSKERYDKEFNENSGTYWYTSGWIERTLMAGEERIKEYNKKFEEYKEKYGEDNAQFLIEQESLWYNNYSRALFVNMSLGNVEEYRRKTKEDADYLKWEFKEVEGDLGLMKKFIDGEWNNGDFLVVEVGDIIKPSYTEHIIKSVPEKPVA